MIYGYGLPAMCSIVRHTEKNIIKTSMRDVNVLATGATGEHGRTVWSIGCGGRSLAEVRYRCGTICQGDGVYDRPDSAPVPIQVRLVRIQFL